MAAARRHRHRAAVRSQDVVVLCDVDQVALDEAWALSESQTLNRLQKVYDETERGRRGRRLDSLAPRACSLPTSPSPPRTRLLQAPPRLQHLGGPSHSRDRRKVAKLSTQIQNQGHASVAAGRSTRFSMRRDRAGARSPTSRPRARAWELYRTPGVPAEKFDKPHGFYNGIPIVDRFKEEMPSPRPIARSWLGRRPHVRSTRPSSAALVSVVDLGNGPMSNLGGHEQHPVHRLDIGSR